MSYLVDVNGNPFLTDVSLLNQSVGALNAAVTATLRGQASATVQVTGIGSLTLTFEGSTDGVNFDAILATPIAGGATTSSTSANGHWININISGLSSFRVRCSAFTSGTATVSVVCSQGGAGPNFSGAGAVKVDLFSTANVALVTASAGIPKVGVVGNAGAAAIFDGATAAAVPANALLAGGRAQNANPTAVTNGQMVALATDLAGKLITTPLAYRTLFGQQATTISATGATTIVTAGAASVFRDLVSLIITTAGLAAQTITISDGTLSWIIDFPDAAVAPAGAFVVVFGDTPLRANAAATAWTANQSLATACHYLAQYVERLA